MTEPTDRVFYQWRVIEPDGTGGVRTRLWRGGMTQAAADAWSAAHPGRTLERMEGPLGGPLRRMLGTGIPR